MSGNSSCIRDSLLKDGSFVLQTVVNELYRGGNQRPDVFFKSNPKLCQKNYNDLFTYGQRQTIQSSGSCNGYNIESASGDYDVSLLVLLAEHTCGLSQSDPLLQRVFEVRNKRNKACHDNGNQLCTDAILRDLLDNLLDLYTNILDKLEERSYSDQSFEKMEIKRRIQERKRMFQDEEEFDTSLCVRTLKSYDSDDDYSYAMPSWSASRQNTCTATRSNSEIPTWGKVALGVTAGIAAFGLAAAQSNKQSEQKKRKDKEEEECSIM